jgi:hypothetical protein
LPARADKQRAQARKNFTGIKKNLGSGAVWFYLDFGSGMSFVASRKDLSTNFSSVSSSSAAFALHFCLSAAGKFLMLSTVVGSFFMQSLQL